MNLEKVHKLVEEDGIVYLSYGGFLTQTLIAGMTEALEKEAEYNDLNMGAANNIYTIFIELAQNMMNYSKSKVEFSAKQKAEGLIVVGRDEANNKYFIHSQNVIAQTDKDKIEPKLQHIVTLDHEQIKKEYRELRRSGRDTHNKGGGIGFYEIAKRSEKIDFGFQKINEDKYYFNFMATIDTKNKKEK